jgi:cysteinyl-tRNA synthetase
MSAKISMPSKPNASRPPLNYYQHYRRSLFMKLYNTLTKQIDDVVPLHKPAVGVYTCGPTVYDYLHVGNWFTYIREDLLIRTLKLSGLQPNWIMNITDVGHLVSDADDGEDKLEKGAKREGKTAWDVANFYTEYFMQGLERLNILMPDKLPRATEHIPEQIELIKRLEEKGHTYIISDGVYFDTSTFPEYADFARLDVDEQQAGARVEFNREKRNPTDFALWKFSPTNQKRAMEWDSPWSPPGSEPGTTKGFPGWHIECSAMSMKYLGETLDIHAGGIDHVPVHHTNEIAQSQAATGKPFAKYWMHSNHITIEGEKISKSLGNGITLEDIEAQGISLEAFRLHVLESHYRSQSKFSWESLRAAQNRLNDLKALAALRHQTIPALHDHATFEFSDVSEQILHIMTEDLHSEAVLAYLSEVTKQTLAVLVSSSEKVAFETMLQYIDDLLGLQLQTVADISKDQKQLLADREAARMAANWEESDRLRDALAEQGVGIRDTSYGAIWFPLQQR